jgi:predicted GNAT family acetyltransferase
MKLDVAINEEENKFFAMVEGKECVLRYRILKNGVLDYYHTFVPPVLRNRGYAGELVDFALAYARDHGFKVVASCPYVAAYIDQHPKWHHQRLT